MNELRVPEGTVPFREATIDLGALARNTRLTALRLAADHKASPELVADLGGDACGHGAASCAPIVLAAGARRIIVPGIDEAIALREAGIDAPIISWLHAPDETFEAARASEVTVAVRSRAEFDAAMKAGPAAVVLVPETGYGVPGMSRSELADSCAAASDARLSMRGLLLFLPDADAPGHAGAISLAERAVAVATEAQLTLDDVIVAGPGGARNLPAFATAGCVADDLFGIGPSASTAPVMTLWAPVVATKAVPGDEGVSYGHIYRTTEPSTLALVSLGYGDGIDRAAGNVAPVVIGAREYTIAGRVAMDALVVDLGEALARPGDPAVLFGDPAAGHPALADWANALHVSRAEITTRLTSRVRRSYS